MNIVLWMIACYSAGNDTNRLALEARRPDGYAAHGGRVLRADARDNRHLVVRLYESREDAEDAARAYKRRPPKPAALRRATLGSGGLRVGLIPNHGAGFARPLHRRSEMPYLVMQDPACGEYQQAQRSDCGRVEPALFATRSDARAFVADRKAASPSFDFRIDVIKDNEPALLSQPKPYIRAAHRARG